MLLRETFGLIAAGLMIGTGLAYSASRLIKSQLYGVAPQEGCTAIEDESAHLSDPKTGLESELRRIYAQEAIDAIDINPDDYVLGFGLGAAESCQQPLQDTMAWAEAAPLRIES